MTNLGLNPKILHHGIGREVFACELASNAIAILGGRVKRPDYRGLLTVEEVAEQAKARWLMPRAARQPNFHAWRKVN
jgi:hypothetical protein